MGKAQRTICKPLRRMRDILLKMKLLHRAIVILFNVTLRFAAGSEIKIFLLSQFFYFSVYLYVDLMTFRIRPKFHESLF